MITSADLVYDPETHASVDPDGRDVPHVTHVLKATGMGTDFDELRQLSPRLAARIDYRCQLGSAVHADCHSYDDNDLTIDQMHPDVRPYVEVAWATCRQYYRLEPLRRERQVYHPVWRYTGILDGIFLQRKKGLVGRDKRILLDLKLGDPDAAAAHLQTAAYEAAYLTEHPDEHIDERWAVQLLPDSDPPYRVTNYSARQTSYMDARIFQACMTVYHNQAARRPRDF